MKRMMTIAATAVLAVALMAPTGALAQSGNFEWSISSSDSDPNVNVSAVAPGTVFLYLWYTGCGPAGMASAEFDLKGQGGISPLAFTPQNGFLNAGGSTNLLLAVGGCPTAAVVAGQIIASVGSTDGAVGMGFSATPEATVVECGTLALNNWPEKTRFVGFASTDYSGARQDHGNGCTTDAVETSSWGDVKALYR